MGKGRHKTPPAIRALTGSRDQTSSAGPSPEFEHGGDAPEWLSEYGRAEWDVVAPQLDRLGMMQVVGVSTLAGYCENVAVMRAASESIQEHGVLVDGRKNPAVTAFDSASKSVRMFASEFGFTPASAAKLSIADGGGDDLSSFLTVHGTAGKTG